SHRVRRQLFSTRLRGRRTQLQRPSRRSLRRLRDTAMRYIFRTMVVIGALACAAIVSAQTRPQTEYMVGPQDVVTIQVFGEADLSGKFTVEQDGTFTYPQLGRIKAAGLTL